MRLPLFTVLTFCGIIVLAACIYFDFKRHQDPHFKKKLKKRRSTLKKVTEKAIKTKKSIDLDDSRKKQVIILNEIQVAEDMMVKNEPEEAVHHFAKAISLCSDPDAIIESLEESLPSFVYEMLLTILINGYGDRFKRLKGELDDRLKKSTKVMSFKI